MDVDDVVLLEVAGVALNALDDSLFDTVELTDDLRLRWMRGLLEQVRERGGVDSPLLKSYLEDDANSWRLHNREAKAEGVPRFPKGGAPEFPRSGSTLKDADRGLTPIGSARGRYARWTGKVLGVSTHDAATVLTGAFRALVAAEVLTAVHTATGGIIYAIPAERVVVRHEDEPRMLLCSVCQAQLGVHERNRSLLVGLPCPTPGCPGELETDKGEGNRDGNQGCDREAGHGDCYSEASRPDYGD